MEMSVRTTDQELKLLPCLASRPLLQQRRKGSIMDVNKVNVK